MQRGHTLVLVDTPPPNCEQWPSAHPPNREELPSLEQFYGEEIRKYRDIDPGFYILLQWTNHGVDEYGATLFVLKLKDRKGNVFHVWAPSSLANSLEMHRTTRFIWNHGLVKDENNGNSFYSFSLC